MRISDWRSDVCSSDLSLLGALGYRPGEADGLSGTRTRSAVRAFQEAVGLTPDGRVDDALVHRLAAERQKRLVEQAQEALASLGYDPGPADGRQGPRTRTAVAAFQEAARSEEHTSELQSLMRISYAGFRLKK